MNTVKTKSNSKTYLPILLVLLSFGMYILISNINSFIIPFEQISQFSIEELSGYLFSLFLVLSLSLLLIIFSTYFILVIFFYKRIIILDMEKGEIIIKKKLFTESCKSFEIQNIENFIIFEKYDNENSLQKFHFIKLKSGIVEQLDPSGEFIIETILQELDIEIEKVKENDISFKDFRIKHNLERK